MESGEPDPLGIGGNSVWWKWTAPANGRIEITTADSAIDTVVYVFTGNAVNALTTVAIGNHGAGTTQAQVFFDANATTTYYIAVHGFNDATLPSPAPEEGDITLELVSPGPAAPANDSFANRIPLTPVIYPFNRSGDSTAGASLEYLASEPILLSTGDASVWYSWTAPSTGQFLIDTFGSTFDTILEVFTGTPSPTLATLVPVATDDDSAGFFQSRVVLDATVGTTYYIAVLGYLGETGTIDLEISNGSLTPPANDDFANRANLLTAFPVTVPVISTESAGIEPYEPSPLEVGGASVWWTWTAPNDLEGYVEINTQSSNFDTVLYVFTGNSLSGLSLVSGAGNDNASGNLRSAVNFAPNPGQVYQIAVHGARGAIGLAGLEIKAGVQPPDYDNFAEARDLGMLNSATRVFNSGVNSTGNRGCGIEPREFLLLQRSPEFEPDGAPAGATAWFRFEAAYAGNYTITTVGSNFDTLLFIYDDQAAMDNLTELAANDDLSGSVVQSSVTFAADVGTQYLIAVGGYLGATNSNISLNFNTGAGPPVNDPYLGRIIMSGTLPETDGITIQRTNVACTVQTQSIEDPEGIGGASAWWRWTAPAGTTGTWVEFNTFGSNFDTVLYVFQGATYGLLTARGYSDDADGTEQSRVNLQVTAGQQYQISVQGRAGDTGAVVLNVASGTPAPGNDNFASPNTSLGSLAEASVTGTNAGAGLEPMEPDPFDNGGASVWWKWIAPAGADWVEVNTIGSNFDTLLDVVQGGSLATLTNLASDGFSAGNGQSRLNFQATPGNTYYFAVHGNQGETGTISLQVAAGMAPPVNDDFADRIFLGSGTSPMAAGSSIGASTEDSEPDPLGFALGSVWWSWEAPAIGPGWNGYAQIDTFGSDYDTILYVFTGSSIPTLSEIARSDDSENTLQSRVNFAAVPGQTYHIALNARNGVTGNFNLKISPGFTPPGHDDFAERIDLGTGITQSWSGTNNGSSVEPGEPDSLDKGGASRWFKWTAGSTAPFQVNTFGSTVDTVLYLYSENTDLLAIGAGELGFNDNGGGTAQSRIDFTPTPGQQFRIAVHGKREAWGTIQVTVTGGAPKPANDDFNPATNPQLTGSPGTASGTNAGASIQHDEPDPLGTGGTSVWWKWTPPSSGWYEIDTVGSTFDTLLYVFTSTVAMPALADLDLVDGNDDNSGAVEHSRVSFLADHTKTYYLVVNGDQGETGPITLNVKSVLDPPDNDDFNDIDGNLGNTLGVTDTVGNAGASIELFEPDSLDDSGQSVWWKWTAPVSPPTQWVQVNTIGSTKALPATGNLDTVLYVYTGPSLESLTERAFNNSGGGQDTSLVNFEATAGVTYHIAVHGDDGDIGSVTVNVIAGVPAPDNDHFLSAAPLLPGTVGARDNTRSNTGASLEHDEPDPIGDGGASVWWKWVPTASDFVQVNTMGSNFDTILYVFKEGASPTLSDLILVGFNDEAGDTLLSRVNFQATLGETYYFAVNGDKGVTGNAVVIVADGILPPFNDNYASTLDLGGIPAVYASAMNEGATFEAGEEALLDASTFFSPFGGPGGASVWYKWQAPSAAPVVVSTLGSPVDTIVYVYTNAGGTLASLSEVAANDDENAAGGIFTSRVPFTPAASTIYYIAVHGSDGDTGTINLSLSSLGPLGTWAAKYSLTGAAALSTADADGDGILNIQELAFGLNPILNSSLGGNDPNRMNQPQFVNEGGLMKLFYTLDPANLNAGALLPITVTGATTLNLFQTIHSNIPPISMGGNSWRVEAPINSPTIPQMQLGVLVTDPN